MDTAYETFSDHVWNHQDELAKAASLDWGRLFGTDWQAEARNVARYYAKQVGCLFTQQSLPVPEGIIRFMDGADRADDFVFALVRDRGRRALHNHAVRRNIDARGYWLPPSSASLTPDGKQIATFSHQPYIGFIGINIDFAKGLSHPSFWDTRETPIIKVTGVPPWRFRLFMARARVRRILDRTGVRASSGR